MAGGKKGSGSKTPKKDASADIVSEENFLIGGTSKHRGKRKLTFGRILKRILLVLLLAILLALVVGGIWFYAKYGKKILELKSTAKRIAATASRDDFKSSQTSICYYADGSVMQVMRGERDVYYLDYAAIPDYAVKAVLATEDRKFYTHKGYDIYAIMRAAKAYTENDGQIRQGGSTITQQLARNVYLNNERTVERKVTEIFLAAELEKRYTKDDIMEFYLNNIYFANGYYGLQSAAKGYFGRTVGELEEEVYSHPHPHFHDECDCDDCEDYDACCECDDNCCECDDEDCEACECLELECPACGKPVYIDEEDVDKIDELECPSCGKLLQLVETEEEAEDEKSE